MVLLLGNHLLKNLGANYNNFAASLMEISFCDSSAGFAFKISLAESLQKIHSNTNGLTQRPRRITFRAETPVTLLLNPLNLFQNFPCLLAAVFSLFLVVG